MNLESSVDHRDSLLLALAGELSQRVNDWPELPIRIGPEGRFELRRQIGTGAMGGVFLAYDFALQREVAIKLPRSGLSARDRRTALEAQALARMDHENIVRLFDNGTWNDSPYLVMEYLSGECLSERLRRGRVPLEEAMQIIVPLLRGLLHMHERGVIHRDLKPSNVFLTNGGTVKIIDLGLAVRPACVASDRLDALNDDPLCTAGSPAYMAPEQWRGEYQDARTDIWAAGVLMYQLFTGELPFAGETLAALRDQICSSTPAPAVRLAGAAVSSRLSSIVDACLVKDASGRLGSARRLLYLLEHVAPGAGQWRKCRTPVNTIARFAASAAAITSESFLLPPG